MATRPRRGRLPTRVAAETVPVTAAAGRVTAAPIWALRSSPDYDAAAMDGIAVRAADTVGASESTPLVLPAGAFEVVDTGDPMPDGSDAVVMREDVHHIGAVPPSGRSCGPRSRRGRMSARSVRTSPRPSCCCRPATGCDRSTWQPSSRPG